MEVSRAALSVRMTDASRTGEARRLASAMARDLGFGETEAGKVAVVVTEAARNLVAHAAGGELLLAPLDEDGVAGIEVLALDRGPGMADVAACLRDGYSTAGTPGTGLGAIARLSAVFDVHSLPGVGTALVARLRARPLPQPAGRRPLEVGAVCLARPGEAVCGDGWAAGHRPDRSLLLLSDGLGHGPAAAEASRAAAAVFRRTLDRGPAEILEAAHAALRSTRGAAVAVAEVDLARRAVRFAGVGNIAAAVVSAGACRGMVSHNGTLGHEVLRIQEFGYAWPPDACLVMHSDGLATRWSLDRYPGLAARHPSLAAGVLYRDYARSRDDVTVLVARAGRGDATGS